MTRLLCMALLLVFLPQGCTRYLVHVRTIPPGEYKIYVNGKSLGTTPQQGDTVVTTEKMGILSRAVLEVKNDTSYGRIGMDYNATATRKVNVCSVKSNVHGDLEKYDVTFLFDVRHTPHALCEKDFDPQNEDRAFIVRPPQAGSVYYCALNLKLVQGDVLKMANENDDHRLMSACIDTMTVRKKFQWTRVDDDFTLKMTMALAGRGANAIDSLPDDARDLANTLNMKYVVAFYGYSFVQHKGITSQDVAASVALSTVGVALLATGGVGFIAIPNGNKVESLLDVYCSIFSVNPNTCMYTTKASLDDDYKVDLNGLVGTLCDTVFKRITPVLRRGEEKK